VQADGTQPGDDRGGADADSALWRPFVTGAGDRSGAAQAGSALDVTATNSTPTSTVRLRAEDGLRADGDLRG